MILGPAKEISVNRFHKYVQAFIDLPSRTAARRVRRSQGWDRQFCGLPSAIQSSAVARRRFRVSGRFAPAIHSM
jgi:hypothetical protein